MRLLRFVVVVNVVGLLACEQRFSSTPPPLGPESLAATPPSSSAPLDALRAANVGDAPGAAASETSHVITVTACSSSSKACSPQETDASAVGVYRVVFGSGRGEIRSRGQAMADLYKELRDRTSSGERLSAWPHATADGGAGAPPGGAPMAKATPPSSDPLAQSASRLIDLVDGVGEVVVDIAPGSGSTGCRLALGTSVPDAGALQCLIAEPDRPRARGRGGLTF